MGKNRLATSGIASLTILGIMGISACTHPGVPEAPTPVVTRAIVTPVHSLRPETGASNTMEGCFSGQMGTQSWGPRVAAATVHIHEPSRLGDKSGSGFVVRDSALDGSTRNRIITAGHVADDIIHNGGLLEIANSAGVPMGYGAVVERPLQHKGRASDGRVIQLGDLAVIEMKGFFAGGSAAFDAIEGIDLSLEFPKYQLEGVFSKPSGIVAGASGSPVLDSNGRAVGVLIGSVLSPKDVNGDARWSASLKMQASDAMWYEGYLAHPGELRSVVMPARSRSFAESLNEQATLSSLGTAGAAAQANPLFDSISHVTIPSFPEQVCVVYHGDMYPAGQHTLSR